MNNLVAKHDKNKAGVHPDKKKQQKSGKEKHKADYSKQLWPDSKK